MYLLLSLGILLLVYAAAAAIADALGESERWDSRRRNR
jgi:hypothetical protein